jgi:hypothetical protein
MSMSMAEKNATKASLVVTCILLVAGCANEGNVTMRQGPERLVCAAPPRELENLEVRAEADILVPKIGQLLKANAGAEVIQQRLRDELRPEVTNWEVIDYRLCMQYASGVLSADEYRRFTAQVLPTLMEVSPTVQQKSSGSTSPAIGNTRGDVIIDTYPRSGTGRGGSGSGSGGSDVSGSEHLR